LCGSEVTSKIKHLEVEGGTCDANGVNSVLFYVKLGVLPRPEGKWENIPLPMPEWSRAKTDAWTTKKALFGQNDYIGTYVLTVCTRVSVLSRIVSAGMVKDNRVRARVSVVSVISHSQYRYGQR